METLIMKSIKEKKKRNTQYSNLVNNYQLQNDDNNNNKVYLNCKINLISK